MFVRMTQNTLLSGLQTQQMIVQLRMKQYPSQTPKKPTPQLCFTPSPNHPNFCLSGSHFTNKFKGWEREEKKLCVILTTMPHTGKFHLVSPNFCTNLLQYIVIALLYYCSKIKTEITSCSSVVRGLVCQPSGPGLIMAVSLKSAQLKKVKLRPTIKL